jgi:hypothetical protein
LLEMRNWHLLVEQVSDSVCIARHSCTVATADGSLLRLRARLAMVDCRAVLAGPCTSAACARLDVCCWGPSVVPCMCTVESCALSTQLQRARAVPPSPFGGGIGRPASAPNVGCPFSLSTGSCLPPLGLGQCDTHRQVTLCSMTAVTPQLLTAAGCLQRIGWRVQAGHPVARLARLEWPAALPRHSYYYPRSWG